ncbi:hypothetical protein [Microvirga lenta]|uniref:hypothetical protein n=1 Tax=Microvirga lenta TaxID=2881337 RepID=UPI001CFFBBC7|nr:hypothetical protein [Microvirga lenta]MCB5177754.1 hypothetical protein [Microvirga lenta]
MVNAIAQYLTEFSLDGKQDTKPLFHPKAPKVPDQDQADETADLVREAEERGRLEGLAAARREFEAELASARTQAEERLAAERMKWVQEEAACFTQQMDEALRNLEARLVDRVARIMTPFLTDALRSQMIEELQATVSSLLANNQNAVFKVSGPKDMLSALSDHLGAGNPRIEIAFNDEIDVSILMGDTFIETQLGAWIGRLAQAVQSS